MALLPNDRGAVPPGAEGDDIRNSFVRAVTALAEEDERILLLSGDLGYMVLEPFMARFPNRFLNMGVAEQNMVGVATGLAEAGFVPFVYSIVTFATLRPYEFVRNGPVLHNLPVRIVGIGGGMEYGSDGLTHYGLEDLAVMRAQPRMTVLAPADPEQASNMIRQTWDLPGPIYYRLSKNGAMVPGLNGRFQLGRPEVIRQGSDLLIVGSGPIVSEAVRAAQLLSEQGLEAEVLVVSTLNPTFPRELAEALARHRLILTVESHYRTGGLGSLVSELVAEGGFTCRVVRCGVPDVPDTVSGGQAYMERRGGLSGEQLAATALESFSGARL